VRLGRHASEVLQSWRLNGTSLPWTLLDPLAQPQDAYAAALAEDRRRGGRRGPVNSCFQRLYQDLAQLVGTRSKAFLQTLLARKHTTQVDAGERENREEAFRKAALRLMFCSPTMELGVESHR